MKTTFALALLGLLACSVPALADQSRSRSIRAADPESCSVECSPGSSINDSNLVILYKGLYYIISKDASGNAKFIFIYNRKTNNVLYFSATSRVGGIINVTSGGSILFSFDNGQAVFVKLTVAVNLSTSSDYKVIFDGMNSFYDQIVQYNFNESKCNFNLFTLIIQVSVGVDISAFLKGNQELAANISANFAVLIKGAAASVKQGAFSTLEALINFEIAKLKIATLFVSIATRVTLKITAVVVTQISGALKAGTEAALEGVTQGISGVVTVLGGGVVQGFKTFSTVVGGVKTSIELAGKASKEWALVIKEQGGVKAGSVWIICTAQYIAIYNTDSKYVGFVIGGRSALFNLSSGSGIVIQNGNVAFVKSNTNISQQFQLYVSGQATLKGALDATYKVVKDTTVKYLFGTSLSSVISAIKSGGNLNGQIGGQFAIDFQVYFAFVKKSNSNDALSVLFDGLQVAAFAKLFLAALAIVAGAGALLFAAATWALYTAMSVSSNLISGFSFSFGISG